MIFLPNIDGLLLVGVQERGAPNKERIMIRALRSIDMTQYGLLLGWNLAGTAEAPVQLLNYHFFWFGDGVLHANDTVFLYTGAGEPRKTTLQGSSATAYVLHWGKPTTLFADSRIVPVIFSIGHVLIDKPPTNVPQLTGLLSLGKALTEDSP